MIEPELYRNTIDALRRRAASELEEIAGVVGVDSPLYLRCLEAWRRREAAAAVSIWHQDLANAEIILDRGVHSLGLAMEAWRGEQIPVEELFALMAAG